MDINSLDRFIEAQEKMYPIALKELKSGKKRSHWMWYIFPQLRGLGRSSMAHTYGISGFDEAKAYLEHPVLSARLIEITEALLTHKDKDIYDIMGDIDAIKLKSSMTLFAYMSEEHPLFSQVLDSFYDGKKDEYTVKKLNMK